jgi:Cu+-exporting ATPase
VQKAEGFKAFPGKGVAASVAGKQVLVGNQRWMQEKGIVFSSIEPKMASLEKEGKTVVLVSVSGRAAGLIAVADTPKERSAEAVKELQSMGIETWMITGDNERTAKAISAKVGIRNVLAHVLPQDKANEVKRLQSGGKVVGFVGDGINDAPALTQADVGIAIGSGTDIAIEAGNIVLIKDDLRDVVSAIRLSRSTVSKIRQNLFWAFFYNIIGIPVAAGALYPFTGLLLNPMIASAAMAFSSVSVVGNSLLLRRWKPAKN